MKRPALPRRPRRRSARRGFTLIELMVVISIIGIMLGLLLPAVQEARNMARNLQCKDRLRGLGAAMGLYAGDNYGSFPYYSPEPAASIGLLYPTYADNVKFFYCPWDSTLPPTTIDMSLTGADVRGQNGAQMSYDSHLSLALAQDTDKLIDGQNIGNLTPLVWDWYGGLAAGEGTPEQRQLNNHQGRGGNVLYYDNHVRWLPTASWSESGNNRVPDFEK